MSGGGDHKKSAAIDARLAQIAVKPLARTPITPNMLSIAGMLIGLWSAWLFSTGDRGAANWAGLLFMVAVWMDHVDGEHARNTGQMSRFGHYLDNIAALVTYGAMFVGMGIGTAGGMAGSWSPLLGIAAGLAVVAIFSIRMWVESRHGSAAITQSQHGGFEIEDTLYIVGPVAWLGGTEMFVIAAGIGTPLFLLWVIWDAIRLSRSAGSDHGEKTAR